MDEGGHSAPPSCAAGAERAWNGDLLDREKQDHRPGHDRLGGDEAHPSDARVRAPRGRWGQRPQGRRHGRLRRGQVPVFGTVAEAIDADRRRRVGGLRAAGVRQGRGHRGDRRGDPALRGDHRGRPGPRHTDVLGARGSPGQQDPHHRPELPRAIASRRLQRGHHPGRHHQRRPDRPGVEVGHADLPAHVRAARHRVLHRGRHRRRPGHRHHPHRCPAGLPGRPGHRRDRDDRRDRRRRRGACRRLHRAARDQAGRRLRRGLHRPRGQDHGSRGRDRVRLGRHRAGQEGGSGEGRRPRRQDPERDRPPHALGAGPARHRNRCRCRAGQASLAAVASGEAP